MADITRLRDAKALKAMGHPLNTPVREATFSPQAKKQIDKAYGAFVTFQKRIDAFAERISPNGFEAMRRAHDKLVYLIRQGTAVTPHWQETADGGSEMTNSEQVAAAAIIGKLTVCTDGWQELFDAADEATNAGKPFMLTAEMFAVLWPLNGKHITGEAS